MTMDCNDLAKLIAIVTPVLSACGFTCKVQGTEVAIFDKKRRIAGRVTADGEVKEQRIGKQNLLGALLKRTLMDAISIERTER